MSQFTKLDTLSLQPLYVWRVAETLKILAFPRQIKPHYRSEGPRQGSCGVFGGSTTLSALFTRVYTPNDVLCH